MFGQPGATAASRGEPDTVGIIAGFPPDIWATLTNAERQQKWDLLNSGVPIGGIVNSTRLDSAQPPAAAPAPIAPAAAVPVTGGPIEPPPKPIITGFPPDLWGKMDPAAQDIANQAQSRGVPLPKIIEFVRKKTAPAPAAKPVAKKPGFTFVSKIIDTNGKEPVEIWKDETGKMFQKTPDGKYLPMTTGNAGRWN